MYIVTLIMELKPDTDHLQIFDFFEKEIAPQTLQIQGVEKINCIQLRSTPYNDYDRTPLRNLFFQIQIHYSSEKTLQAAMKLPLSMELIEKFLAFSKCTFHWFIGYENNFSRIEQTSLLDGTNHVV
ncbi:hypothetical protein [Shimazuella kribbensis]|uniref:hypothetical protein n=1 Tax=Shimazuella kribbensis TaxID=139808 RepID=UPI0004097A36|nr:hypothetical protein [Shimazuella kribbensis]